MNKFFAANTPLPSRLLLLLFLMSISTFTLFSKDVKVGNSSNYLKIKSNSYQSLELNFSLNNLKTEEIITPNGTFTKFLIDDYSNSYTIGSPDLPVLRKIIEVPVNAEIKINILNSEFVEYSFAEFGIKYPIIPSQPHVSKDTTKTQAVFRLNNAAYLINDFNTLNPQKITVDKIGTMRGINIARINICPFEYNPAAQKIKIYTKLEIEIVFENADITKTLNQKKINSSPYFASAFKNIINYKSLNDKVGYTNNTVKYVIVSDPMFKDSLQKFINWKTRKGFKVIEAYTDNLEVGNTVESIKNYLTNLYLSSTQADPPPTFILFVGDIAQVPSFRGTASENYYYTDLPYAEYTGDYLPEVFYGRFSANNITELMPQINKTMEYEEYTMPDPSYLNNAILIAGYDNSYSYMYANGQMNYATTNYFNSAHGFNTFYSKYPASAKDTKTIKERINAGAGFINYSAHGNWDGWVNPGLRNTDIAAMQNKDKYALMIGNACYTQSFDKYSCFGEELLRAVDKGAIGYIGASSESYWDEDFWWSVGFCNIDTLPKYGGTKSLGAYDRLFHTHKEQYNEWYLTQGQMLFGGNLSVLESGSPYSDFYWEIYTLMGDPSVMIYLSQPSDLKIDYEKVQPQNISTINFITESYTYVAISKDGKLLGTALADSNGIANIYINSSLGITKADIIATRQNRRPYFDTITFVTSQESFIILNSRKIKTSNSRNEDRLNFGDSVLLDINLKNVGNTPALNVKATLSCNDKFITMKDSANDFGKINALDSTTIQNAFSFLVDSIVPDQHSAAFKLEITDISGKTWTSHFNILIGSPAFKFGRFAINDNATGNGNKKLEPGETADIIIPTTNFGHAYAMQTIGRLSTLNQHIKINKKSCTIGDLKPDSTVNTAFSITADKSIAQGTLVQLTYIVMSGSYMYIKYLNVIVGSASEDFESASFNKYKWVNETYHPWVIYDTLPLNGKHCARSSYMTGGGSSALKISFNVSENDSISFYRKILADTNGNYLQFFIDDDMIKQWTGIDNWTKFTYSVKPGYHTFKWIFVKYSADDNKSDCALLDDISFPHSTDLNVDGFNDITAIDNDFNCFPNPFSNVLNISYRNNANTTSLLKLYNYSGQLITNIDNDKNSGNGEHSMNIDFSDLKNGIYFLKLETDNKSITKKIIKLK